MWTNGGRLGKSPLRSGSVTTLLLALTAEDPSLRVLSRMFTASEDSHHASPALPHQHFPVNWKAPLYGYSVTGSRLDRQEFALELRNHGAETDTQTVPSVLPGSQEISKAMPPYPRCVLIVVEPAGTARGRITFLHRTSNVSLRGGGPTSSPDTSTHSWRSRGVVASGRPVHSGLLRRICVFIFEGIHPRLGCGLGYQT